MKATQKATKLKVKLLRGIVGEDGKNHKAGETVELTRNTARIVVNAGRGELVTGKSAD